MNKMEINVVITENEDSINVSSDIKGTCSGAGIAKGIARILYAIEQSTNVKVVSRALKDYARMREESED